MKKNSLFLFVFVLFGLTFICQTIYADNYQQIHDKANELKEDAKRQREEKINSIIQQRDKEVEQVEQKLGELQKSIDSNASELLAEGAIVKEYALKIKKAPDFASEGKKRLSDEFEKSVKGQEAITQEMDIRLKNVLEQCKLQIDEENIMDMLTEVYGGCSVADLRKQHSSLEFEQAIMQFENISNDIGDKWLDDFKNKYPRITKGLKTTIRETSGKTYTGTIKSISAKFVSIQQPKSPKADKIELSSLDYYSKQRLKDEISYNSFVNEEYRMHKKSKKADRDTDNVKIKMLLKLNYFPKMILAGEEFIRIPDNFFNVNEWMKIEECLDKFYKEAFLMLSEEYVSKHGFHFHEGRGIWLPDEMESWENTLRAHKKSESQLKKQEDELLAQKNALENKISSIKFNAQRSIKNAESVYKKSIDEIASAERAAIDELKQKEAEEAKNQKLAEVVNNQENLEARQASDYSLDTSEKRKKTKVSFQCFWRKQGKKVKINEGVMCRILSGEHGLYSTFTNLLEAESQKRLFKQAADYAEKSSDFDSLFGDPLKATNARIASLEADTEYISALKAFSSAENDFVNKVVRDANFGDYNGKGVVLSSSSVLDFNSCMIPYDTTITIYVTVEVKNNTLAWCKVVNTAKRESISLEFFTDYNCIIF